MQNLNGIDDYTMYLHFSNDNDPIPGPSRPAKRPKSLSLKKPGKEKESTQFEEVLSVPSKVQYNKLARDSCQKNTGKSTNWAISRRLAD